MPTSPVSRTETPLPSASSLGWFSFDSTHQRIERPVSHRPGDTLAKVADWPSAGTSLVWVIDPERRLARVYRHDSTETLVSATEALSGEDLLPGFTCPLDAIV